MDISGTLNLSIGNDPKVGWRFPEDRLREVDPLQPETDVITWAASRVRSGGMIIYPTETFYGLGGDPSLPEVVERIYRLKERERHKPLPLIASDEAAARRVAHVWPEVAERLAHAFWPGPLTLVVAASRLPLIWHAQTGKIAVRVSSHAVAHDLAAAAGGLLISTSANLAGKGPCAHPDRLSPELVQGVDVVLHAGATPGGLPSTLVDVTVDPPRLLRAGAIAWERVRQVLA